MRIKKSTLWAIGIIFVVIIVIFLWNSLLGNPNQSPTGLQQAGESTFYSTGDTACTDSNNKPYVFMFSTTWCPHCVWIKDTFDGLANEEFADEINLQHWELDTGDNPLTFITENRVPAEFESIYKKYNPQGSIPTFVFGCEYIRIGNGYEMQNDLNAEMEDFKLIINKLLE